MDQILSDGKNLPSASGRCVVAGDKDQEWGTSGAIDWATSILAVCQRPPKCHQCDNAAFRRWRQYGLTSLKRRIFAGLPLQCLESLSIPPNATVSLLDGLFHFNYPLPLEVRAFPYRLQALVKTWRSHEQFLLTLHPLQRGCLQRKVRWSFAELSASTFAPLNNTLARPNLEYSMQACLPNLLADADCLEQIQR